MTRILAIIAALISGLFSLSTVVIFLVGIVVTPPSVWLPMALPLGAFCVISFNMMLCAVDSI